MIKENAAEYNLSEKNIQYSFYSALNYIHKLSMLSHVKYRNSKFMLIKLNPNKIWAPQCKKQNFSEHNLSE